ncbi:acyl-coenzyme A thioesterase THEM4-like [Patiria miniata]|uniref:Acyl-coenzyme A thioesterase THEM4 n=1 Tax=Patiria miniata TaxID=46514 RepID=A0A914BTT9_PATMI|nr:acyl-coenzyme A thioesterase THEM4-like [Patiria miniata]
MFRALITRRNMQMATGVASSARNDWLPETEQLYSRLRAQADRDGWVQVRNTTTDPRPSRSVFSRIATANGPVMQYALFLQKDERKLMGVCQFGEEAQGPPGFAHGGALATMHDAITGVLVDKSMEKPIVTASLTTNYRRPTPLMTAVQMEAHVDKIEGKRIYTKSSFKSPDGATLYSDCSALFVNIEDKLRALKEKSDSTL